MGVRTVLSLPLTGLRHRRSAAGRLKGDNRTMASLRGRTRDSSWQWLVIGVILGLGCSGVLCLGLYLSNVIRFGVPGQADIAAAPTVIVITETSGQATQSTAGANVTATSTQALQVLASATPLVAGSPVAATITPFEQVPTEEKTNVNPGAALVPSPTVVGTVIASPPPPTIPPTQALATAAQPGSTINNPTPLAGNGTVTGAGAGTLPPSISGSELVTIQGGIFEMGTTTKEMQNAVVDCTTRDKGKCDISMAEDSFPAHNVTVNTFRMEKYEVSYE